MRIVTASYAQHIGRGFKNLWKIQNKREILEFGVRAQLENKGIQVVDLTKAITIDPILPKQTTIKTAAPISPRELRTHPDWHEEPCRIYHNHTSLIGGLDQGLNLTRTALVSDNSLPSKVDSFLSPVDQDLHQKLQQSILYAHALDAVQEKLPRGIDYKKPGWVHPREYGLTKRRRNEQLMSKMFNIMNITLTQKGVDVSGNQPVMGAGLKEVLQASGDPLLVDILVTRLLCSKKPLGPYSDPQIQTDVLSKPLPSIYPLEPTVSIFPQHVYRLESLNPVKSGAPYPHFNMAVFCLNMPIIKMQPAQLQARMLVHTFGTAASYAKRRFGGDVVELPEPVALNCVHTDGRNFIFGCLQVHSLDMNGPPEARNLLWMTESMPLFEQCGYVDYKPTLRGYNPRVIETFLALYHSQLSASQ